jgi:hypothetical protein
VKVGEGAAGQAGEESAQDKGQEFVAEGVDADRLRSLLVFAYGDHAQAQPGTAQEVGDADDQHQDAQLQIVTGPQFITDDLGAR